MANSQTLYGLVERNGGTWPLKFSVVSCKQEGKLPGDDGSVVSHIEPMGTGEFAEMLIVKSDMNSPPELYRASQHFARVEYLSQINVAAMK